MKKVVALMLAGCLILVGVTYGYWTDQTTIQGKIETGRFHMIIGNREEVSLTLGTMSDGKWNASDDIPSFQVGQDSEKLQMTVNAPMEIDQDETNAVQLSYPLIQGEDGTINLFEEYEEDKIPVYLTIQSGRITSQGKTRTLTDTELAEYLNQMGLKNKYEMNGQVKVAVTQGEQEGETQLQVTKTCQLPFTLEQGTEQQDEITLVFEFHSETVIGQKVPSLCLYTYCLWSQRIKEEGTLILQQYLPSDKED